MSYQDQVPASVRTLRILESVVGSHTGLTAAQLAHSLHIPRSAVYTLLKTLMRMGYIVQEGPRKPYIPGPRLWDLNHPYPTGTDALVSAFRTETTRSNPEETYALAILSGKDTVILAETPAKHTVRCVVPPGQRADAATDPAGLILLAGRSPTVIKQVLIPYDDRLAGKLADTRRNIVLIDKQTDLFTLTAPICPDGHHPEAALKICCPTFRWSAEYLLLLNNTVRETAARISYRLGASMYHPYEEIGVQPSGVSVPMSEDDLDAFLKVPWAARLACIRPDGSPHVVPVWYEWQDGLFIIIAWPHSVWASLVTANKTVALSIDEPWPPLRRVMIRGEATEIPQDEIPGGIDTLRHRISSRYLGGEFTSHDSTTYSSGWSAFRISPQRIIALKQPKD